MEKEEIKNQEDSDTKNEEREEKSDDSIENDEHHVGCAHSIEIEALRNQVRIYEEQIESIKKEADKKVLDFVDKKTKEITEIIRKKEQAVIDKHQAELENNKKYLYESQFGTLAEIVSQFENVINMTTDPSVSNYLVGFKMFLSQFNDLLQELGISSIEPKLHEEFDSEIMQVFETINVNEQDLDNKIVKLVSKGYKLHDRVIKFATVGVGKFE